MLKYLGIFALLVGFLAFAVGASPIGDEAEIAEINTPEGMVLIPAGTLEMGSADKDADDDEQPVHTVHLDAFYMDEYEVTNAQFKVFVDANPAWGKDNIEDGFHWGGYLRDWDGNTYPSGKANHPVTHVSWYAAMAYAKWAGKRLPTEAEWEYAARGGLAGKKYPWGDTITRNDAKYDSNYDFHLKLSKSMAKWNPTAITGNATRVGAYADNGYGLYDMAGNVWEWCLDAYDADFYAVSENSRNPIVGGITIHELRENFTSIPTDTSRVLRGGSWGDRATFLRVANRDGDTPTVTNRFFGFRCVRDVAR